MTNVYGELGSITGNGKMQRYIAIGKALSQMSNQIVFLPSAPKAKLVIPMLNINLAIP
jgi:hypothetical protein